MRMDFKKTCNLFILFLSIEHGLTRPKNTVTVDLKCKSNFFHLTGSRNTLYGWPSNQVKVGNCTLNEEYVLNETYSGCDVRPIVKGDYFIYTFQVRSQINPNAVINRRRPFLYTVNCLVKRKTLIKANPVDTSSSQKSDTSDGGSLSVSTIRKYLQRQDADGNVISEGNDFLVYPGSGVQILVTGDRLWELGLEVYATDCYLKPLVGVDKKFTKFLVKKSCPVDNNITVDMYPNGQFIRYTGFLQQPKDSLPYYFHCDLIVCRWDEQCSFCENR